MGFLLLLFSLSLVVSGVLFGQLRKLRQENFAVRLDPLGRSVYEKTNASEGAIVFFGDSRAKAWTLPNLPGRVCLTRGVGRQTTAQVRARLEKDVLRLKPSCVVLECGINDLRTLPLFPERRSALRDDCLENIRVMVAALKQNHVRVVLCTIFPVRTPKPWQEPFWSGDIQGLTKEINNELRKLAGDGVQVLETEPLLADPSGQVSAELALDHLHLNAAGYAKLNDSLVTLL
jgi:lysophospholipase L1-like esterase